MLLLRKHVVFHFKSTMKLLLVFHKFYTVSQMTDSRYTYPYKWVCTSERSICYLYAETFIWLLANHVYVIHNTNKQTFLLTVGL